MPKTRTKIAEITPITILPEDIGCPRFSFVLIGGVRFYWTNGAVDVHLLLLASARQIGFHSRRYMEMTQWTSRRTPRSCSSSTPIVAIVIANRRDQHFQFLTVIVVQVRRMGSDIRLSWSKIAFGYGIRVLRLSMTL